MDWNSHRQKEYAVFPDVCVLGLCVPDYEYHFVNRWYLISFLILPHNKQ
jgi:hypothetical protein